MKEYAPKIKKMALLCSILKKGGLEAFLRLLEALLRQALLHSGMISILYKHILIIHLWTPLAVSKELNNISAADDRGKVRCYSPSLNRRIA